MARISPAAELPTVWTVPDNRWRGFIVPILKNHDPEPRTGRPRINQCKAFDGIIFIRCIGEEKLGHHGRKTRPARHRVVERCRSWWNGCRSILVRWAKNSCNYLAIAFIELDSALLWYRRIKL